MQDNGLFDGLPDAVGRGALVNSGLMSRRLLDGDAVALDGFLARGKQIILQRKRQILYVFLPPQPEPGKSHLSPATGTGTRDFFARKIKSDTA